MDISKRETMTNRKEMNRHQKNKKMNACTPVFVCTASLQRPKSRPESGVARRTGQEKEENQEEVSSADREEVRGRGGGGGMFRRSCSAASVPLRVPLGGDQDGF